MLDFPSSGAKMHLIFHTITMQLEHKPDFEEAKTAWRHFWARETWKRPLVTGWVPRDPKNPLPWEETPLHLAYYRKMKEGWASYSKRIDAYLESTIFPAEAIPMLSPDLGPDQFAAFLGPELQFSEGSPDTNWIHPVVEDWDAFDFRLEPKNPSWVFAQDLARKLADHARGRYLVSTGDLHSNADALSALRNPELLCMDFLDEPEKVCRAMQKVRKMYQPIYNGLYEAAGRNVETGTIVWLPTWSDGKFAVVQCDFICMVSCEIAREFIIPALEEETAFLDHAIYHLDCPGALRHLDDILSIKGIHAIEWVSGAGQKPMWQWTDVLKKCQAAGKSLIIEWVSCEEVKQVHRELDPAGVVYSVSAQSLAEIEDLCAWLEKNT